MKIVIDPLNPASIVAARKQLMEYQRNLNRKCAEFARRLAEIGVSVAEAGFSTADYDGINDVTVVMRANRTGAQVIAKGKTVGFIEFGTGVKFPEYKSDGLEYTPPAHGSYGKGKGANPKGWYFSNSPGSSQHTYGNPPAEAMLTARNAMLEQITKIAREVFRE